MAALTYASLALVISVVLYVWLFNFIDGLPLRALLARLSSHQGRLHLLRTAFSLGFVKSSFRRCRHHLYRWLVAPIPRVTLGSAPPRDCSLVSLAPSGQPASLTSLLASAGSKPLILTFGSWS